MLKKLDILEKLMAKCDKIYQDFY